MNQYLKMAKRLAESHAYDDSLEYRLCAVIVRGGAVLSVGFNKRTNSALMDHYAVRDHQTVHAEVDAVLQVRKNIDLTGAKIYVVRLLKCGETAISKPCGTCQAVLRAYGIKKMVYTLSGGGESEEKIPRL